jgi:hypothetical protein
MKAKGTCGNAKTICTQLSRGDSTTATYLRHTHAFYVVIPHALYLVVFLVLNEMVEYKSRRPWNRYLPRCTHENRCHTLVYCAAIHVRACCVCVCV